MRRLLTFELRPALLALLLVPTLWLAPPLAPAALAQAAPPPAGDASTDETSDETSDETTDGATEGATDEAAEGATDEAAEGDLEERVIRISGEGIATSGNPRYGPITYRHPSDPEGVVADVSNLTIFAQEAVLRVPGNDDAEGDARTSIGAARGEREADFQGGVRALRGRLEALGPALVYSEASGLGTLTGGAEVTIEPAEEGDDPTAISSAGVEFDVDTDRSRSFGDVVLVSGNQRAVADAMVFAEAQDLGCLTSESGQPSITRTSESGDELLITADEICVLTGDEKLYARGDVTVVDGAITSTGAEVFYDDTEQVAEVIGSAEEPAVSVDEANDTRLEAARIRQDIEFDFVEPVDASAPQGFERALFEFAPTAADDLPDS